LYLPPPLGGEGFIRRNEMTTLVQSMQNNTFTTNGASTYKSSLSPLVDWFFHSGSFRYASKTDILEAWEKVWNANPEAALRLLFYTRDIRGGQGERNAARIVFEHLATDAKAYPVFESLIHYIPEYGRWDDLFVLFGTPLQSSACALISNALDEENALCAKWLPSESSKRDYFGIKGHEIALAVRKYMNLTPRQYRKLRTRLNSVVESKMCAKEWKDIDFSRVPSKAMLRLRNAFIRNAEAEFEVYLEDVATGKTKINAGTVVPHEIAQLVLNTIEANGWGYCELHDTEDYSTEREMISLQWANLPNYLKSEGSKHSILPVVDTSGSMYADDKPRPIDVSIGLGAYLAERNEGPFKDAFITFSEVPEMQLLKGDDIFDKMKNLSKASWGGSTNLTKTFDIILAHAKMNSLHQRDMPTMVMIFSDMQFDSAVGNYGQTDNISTTYQLIEQKFLAAGYIAPQIVFWNIHSQKGQVPVQAHQSGASLVSGFSPAIMQQLLKTGSVTPIDLVMEVLNSERYSQIKI